MELTNLLKECVEAFRGMDENEILRAYRPKLSNLTGDERLAVKVCVGNVFMPVYKLLKAEDEGFTEEDLMVCALSALGFKTAVIAECMAISGDAIRMRKRRIRRKIGDERYEVIFGPIERASAKTVVQDEKAAATEAEVLPVAKAGKREGVKEKMKFGYAVSSCFRKMFTFSGRARRAEYWFYFLFMNMVWLGFKAVKGLVINCFMPMASMEVQSCASLTNDIICWCATVALMIPMLAVTVRRLHDLGDTGWLSVAIYLLPWLVGVGFTIYTDNFTDLTLDVIGESIDGLMGLVGSYMAFYLFELAALIARVIMMARKGTVGENEYGADPIRYIG
jgi:Predicted membrane protein